MRYDDERLNHDNTMQSCQRAEKKLKEATKALTDAKLDLEQVICIFGYHQEIFSISKTHFCS